MSLFSKVPFSVTIQPLTIFAPTSHANRQLAEPIILWTFACRHMLSLSGRSTLLFRSDHVHGISHDLAETDLGTFNTVSRQLLLYGQSLPYTTEVLRLMVLFAVLTAIPESSPTGQFKTFSFAASVLAMMPIERSTVRQLQLCSTYT